MTSYRRGAWGISFVRSPQVPLGPKAKRPAFGRSARESSHPLHDLGSTCQIVGVPQFSCSKTRAVAWGTQGTGNRACRNPPLQLGLVLRRSNGVQSGKL